MNFLIISWQANCPQPQAYIDDRRPRRVFPYREELFFGWIQAVEAQGSVTLLQHAVSLQRADVSASANVLRCSAITMESAEISDEAARTSKASSYSCSSAYGDRENKIERRAGTTRKLGEGL